MHISGTVLVAHVVALNQQLSYTLYCGGSSLGFASLEDGRNSCLAQCYRADSYHDTNLSIDHAVQSHYVVRATSLCAFSDN
jgi:hypothetical protein